MKGSLSTSVGNFSRLLVLDLNYNYLAETIPPSLSTLISLLILDVSRNQLKRNNSLLERALSNLVSFNLVENCLSGMIPDSFANVRSLRELFLSNNLLIDCIPDIYNQLSKLKYFEASENNYLANTIPSSISTLQLLDSLFLQNNNLSGIN